MLTIRIDHNIPAVLRGLALDAKQATFAAAIALNRTAEWCETALRRNMRSTFDRPTPWFMRSLRIIRANVKRPPVQAVLWFKDRSIYDTSETMVLPHVEGGPRKLKPMELRLQRANLLPRGWYAVPGGAAEIDANGNMSRGQITQMLNVLGTYTESGYNKANKATAVRLARGNAKKNTYGFAYWVNPVGGPSKHIAPGVYKRVQTGFGSSLKPVLIFVNRVQYRKRFDFYGIVDREFERRFPGEFDRAFADALRTARA